MQVVSVELREGENPKTPNAHEFMKLFWDGENPKTPLRIMDGKGRTRRPQ